MNQEQNNNIALLIDGENIPPNLADFIHLAAARKGTIVFACVYGNLMTLKSWQSAIDCYHLAVCENQISKNAADVAMKRDARRLFTQSHVKRILFATQDGDFAKYASKLQKDGCEVYGAGSLQRSEKLVRSCITYTVIREIQGLKKP